MDRETIIAEIDKLTEMLNGMSPLDENYKAIQNARKELHEMLLKEEKAIEDRSYRNQQIDLEERRLMNENYANTEKIKQSKLDGIFGVVKTVVGIIGSFGLMLLLDETKRENIIDKDLFSVARGWFPRG